MKSFFIILISLGVALAISNEVCYDDVLQACSPTGNKDSISCNSIYGGFEYVKSDLQAYIDSLLTASYDFLSLGTHFNTYKKNRPGISKVINDLSDREFDNAINLIKYVTKRGGDINFFQKNDKETTISTKRNKLEVDELNAFAIALDTEKQLARAANKIHARASRATSGETHYDPEVSQYLEENFIEKQSGIIRELSGYTNDLSKFAKKADPSLAIYLFDEYLQKK